MSSLKDQEVLDYYMFDNDKHMFSSQSGKQRTKREAEQHTNRFDPNGHSRKLCEKLRNADLKTKRLDRASNRSRKSSETSTDDAEE